MILHSSTGQTTLPIISMLHLISTPQQRAQVVWLLEQPKTCTLKKSWHLAHWRWGSRLSGSNFNFFSAWPLSSSPTPESDILLSEIVRFSDFVFVFRFNGFIPVMLLKDDATTDHQRGVASSNTGQSLPKVFGWLWRMWTAIQKKN